MYTTPATAGQIAEIYNAMFSKQMDAYGRKASYVMAGYDVPSTGPASGLPKVIRLMVRLDGCTNDKTPYKKDPILDNGYISDAKSFGGAEYKHGQKAVAYNPAQAGGAKGNAGGAPVPAVNNSAPSDKNSKGENMKASSSSRLTAAVTTVAVMVPALFYAYLL
ncbi:MAG: hypothetical protein J3Q66DRAFT_75918 [Benniella sp.]|nr:MAG: hypothetical protein J3Q66DRAFT_75918 [Benniella sp.]